MNFNFVYSSGGGAGDWNGINRVWKDSMPGYFKNHLLIKFGDIFFNHKGINSLIKPQNWKNVGNGRDWLNERVNDSEIYSTDNLILDVGTTKIVNYISFKNPSLGPIDVIEEFDRIIENENILEKYCDFIMNFHHRIEFIGCDIIASV